MKIYTGKDTYLNRSIYMVRSTDGTWALFCEEPHDFDWKVRDFDHCESKYLEDVYKHFTVGFQMLVE